MTQVADPLGNDTDRAAGLAIRDGAPDESVNVVDPEKAAASCDCRPGACEIAGMFDDDSEPLFPTNDGI